MTEVDIFTRAKTACEKLRAAFPDRVTTPNDANYQEEICKSWSVTSRTRPAAIVRLESAEEVAKAVLIVKDAGSKFAIRSGGHNANPGFSSVGEVGVILDLSGLNSKILSSQSSVRLGAGNNWADVFKWLEREDLCVIGSREGRVGVSGFLLNAGQGIFSSLYGLGVDGVQSFEVVLADGAIVRANAKDHADLYLALKGGGSNFGIVTAVDLETHPLTKVWYAINMYNPSDIDNVINEFVKLQQALEHDSKIGMFINTRRHAIAVGMFYADWLAKVPPVFEPFFKLDSRIAEAAPPSKGTFSSISDALEQWAYKEKDLKHSYVTMTTKVSVELYKEAHLCWKEIVSDLPDTVDLHWSIQPLTHSAVKAGKARGGNILGLEEVSQSCWIFSSDWISDDDEIVTNALHAVLAKVKKLAVDRGLSLNLLFPTFAGSTQNVLAGFGEENVKKLQQVAAIYDPTEFFQKDQNGGFLLRNV